MAGVIAWVIRSPRRLIAVLAVPLLLTLLATSLWSARNRDSGGNGNAGAAAAAANAQVPDATPFVTAAVKFVNVWGRLAPGQSPTEWHEAVNALVTPDLATRLEHTDTNALEGATVTGKPQVRFVTATSSLIAVPMSNGHTVVVTVVAEQNQSWLVDDVQPDVGN
jgi:hypothetical protein